MLALLVLLVASRVLAVSIHDEVLPWMRDAWAALGLPQGFPEAELSLAVRGSETFEDLISHLQDSPDIIPTLGPSMNVFKSI